MRVPQRRNHALTARMSRSLSIVTLTVAFAMLGASAMVAAKPGHHISLALLARGTHLLERLLGGARRPDWSWFETVLGYDNPRLPQALIEAGRTLGREDYLATGLETLDWIAERQTAASGHFRPIGSESFGIWGVVTYVVHSL